MQLIKSAFLVGLVLTIISAGAFVMYNRGFFQELPSVNPAQLADQHLKPLLPNQLASLLPKVTSDPSTTASNSADLVNSSDTPATTDSGIGGIPADQLSQLPFNTQDASDQLGTLAERGQEVSEQIGKVLGEFVEVNENNQDQAAHERAFEYGQYLYCQQVIIDYEKNTTAP